MTHQKKALSAELLLVSEKGARRSRAAALRRLQTKFIRHPVPKLTGRRTLGVDTQLLGSADRRDSHLFFFFCIDRPIVHT